MGQFRYPHLDKSTIGIVVLTLLDGIVDTNGVDAGVSGLHLKLGIVNPRFEVGK